MDYCRIVGIYTPPRTLTVPKNISISKHLSLLLPDLTPDSPILIQAGTGFGKTRAILASLIPFAQEHGQSVCFVSSRCAINAQFKRSLAKALGEDRILSEYSEEGLRNLSQIGSVTILTYHSLYSNLKSSPSEFSNFDFLVFDEVHALALDACFVPFTGDLLDRIPRAFFRARRIYLSATPEPILEPLCWSEGSRQLTVYRWKPDLSSYRLYFYSSHADLVSHFKTYPASEKVLWFVPSIKLGEVLVQKFPNESKVVNSHTKQDNPVEWNRLLAEQALSSRITVATNALDAGISLTDPDLKHIVCSGLDIAEILQQAGRKRLKSGEKINLYLWSPSRKSLNQQAFRHTQLLEEITLCSEHPFTFAQRFLLDDEDPEIRHMCRLTPPDTLEINPLARRRVEDVLDLLRHLSQKQGDHPTDKYFCQMFGQDLPTDNSRWLDGRYSIDQKKELLDWLQGQVGHVMDKAAQARFSTEFKEKYQHAFGARRNDRADRSWGLAVIRSVLLDLNWGFFLESTGGFWRLYSTQAELANA